jgi:hypothetical protein
MHCGSSAISSKERRHLRFASMPYRAAKQVPPRNLLKREAHCLVEYVVSDFRYL